MSRKIIIYQKQAMKPVILTDDMIQQPITELRDSLLTLMNSEKIMTIQTKSDCLIIRPSEVQAILISEGDNPINGDEDTKSKKYDKKLELGDSHAHK